MDYPCFQRPAFLTGHYCTAHWDLLQRAPHSEPQHASTALHSSVHVDTHTHTHKHAKACRSSDVSLVQWLTCTLTLHDHYCCVTDRGEDSRSHVQAGRHERNGWWIQSLHLTNQNPVCQYQRREGVLSHIYSHKHTLSVLTIKHMQLFFLNNRKAQIEQMSLKPPLHIVQNMSLLYMKPSFHWKFEGWAERWSYSDTAAVVKLHILFNSWKENNTVLLAYLWKKRQPSGCVFPFTVVKQTYCQLVVHYRLNMILYSLWTLIKDMIYLL